MLFPMLEELLSPLLDVADGIELMQRKASRYAIGMGCLSEILHVASESLYSVVLSNLFEMFAVKSPLARIEVGEMLPKRAP